MSYAHTTIRQLSNAEVLKALGRGNQTYAILDRLRYRLASKSGEHLLLAQLRRRLRQMERDGLVRMRAGWSVTNSLFWEPTLTARLLAPGI